MKILTTTVRALSLAGALAGAACVATACSDWLDTEPADTQQADKYWTSKADVDNMLMGGYSYLRSTVESKLIALGEQRAGLVYLRSNPRLQQLDIRSTDAVSDWTVFYQIVNTANVVIANAARVQEQDPTYTEGELRSHLTEAYFLRALAYFYLVRNWRDVPLVTDPVEDDTRPFLHSKATEADVIAQIKQDVRTALESGAAKEEFETTWETKGRATRWALNALMADVCLWAGDYQECIDQCDAILASRSTRAPQLLTDPSRSTWYSMFNPGNSRESIFELQWNYEEDQTNTLPTLFGPATDQAQDNYRVSPILTARFGRDYEDFIASLDAPDQGEGEGDNPEAVRSLWGGVYSRSGGITSATTTVWSYIYKYSGMLVGHSMRTAQYYDPNYIIYRVADIVLMKAEALLLVDGIEGGTRSAATRADDDDEQEADEQEGGDDPEGGADDQLNPHYRQAVELINRLRRRAAVSERTLTAGMSQVDLLQLVLEERMIELAGEGKIWYDLLRMGRRSPTFRQQLLIDNVIEFSQGGTGVKESTIKNILADDGLCFLPVYADELERDSLLVQNPSYKQ